MDDIVNAVAVGVLFGVAVYAAMQCRGGQTWDAGSTWTASDGDVLDLDTARKALPPVPDPLPLPPRTKPKACVAILPRRLVIASALEMIAWGTPDSVANCADNDPLVAATIADLWRTDPPQDIYTEDD